jgi:hypothetical protein
MPTTDSGFTLAALAGIETSLDCSQFCLDYAVKTFTYNVKNARDFLKLYDAPNPIVNATPKGGNPCVPNGGTTDLNPT